jgi:acetylornithine deacetylase
MTSIEILEKLISFNTIMDKDNFMIMDFVGDFLSKKGFEVEYIFNNEQNKKCLIAKINNPNLMFIGHTDTVNYSNWTYDPFKLTKDGNKLHGLGACDMKGGIASILSVISKIDLNKNKIALYFTNDEEIGFGGIKDIKDLIVPNNIIVSEPTNNIPIYGTKGLLELEIIFYGVKCPSYTHDKGINAIYDCVDFISRLKRFYNKKLKTENIVDFEIPYTTMNIGMINGGETINSVPGKCTLIIDFRIAKARHIEIIKNKLEEILKKYQANMIITDIISPRLNLNDISFLEEISEKKQTKCYLTEASAIDKNTIILGTGPDTSHQKNEYTSYELLKKTEKLYQVIIEYYNKKN